MKKRKGKLEKELQERKENKKLTLMEMFIDNSSQFEITEDSLIDKMARQHIKETIHCNRVIRKDNMKHSENLVVPKFDYIIQLTESNDTVYFSVRKRKNNVSDN